MISNCDMGVSRDGKPRDPFDTSHDLEDRWKDPVMWLAVELVYIDSQIRQKSRYVYNIMLHVHCMLMQVCMCVRVCVCVCVCVCVQTV